MTTQINIDLPDHIYRQIKSMAQQSQRDIGAVVAEVVSRSVQPFPVNPNREAMLKEVAAYREMHPSLWRDYPGQHVAIFGGELVDHDPDPVALLQRIRHNYPGRTVLRRKVEPVPERTLR